MPQIRVQKEVHEKLKQIKEKLRHRSMNETIDYLIHIATNPKGFIEGIVFWLEDMRNDLKKLLTLLERLAKINSE